MDNLTSKIEDSLKFLGEAVKTAMPLTGIFLALLGGYIAYNTITNRESTPAPRPRAPTPIERSCDLARSNQHFMSVFNGDEYTEDPINIQMSIEDRINCILNNDSNLPNFDLYKLKKQPKFEPITPNKSEQKKPKTGKQTYASKNIQNLMSNEFFRDTQFMSREDITNLLTKYNSCLQNRGVEDIIVAVSREYNINPAILLARPQVEQRLLTKQKASKRALNYATGYGAFDNGKTLKSGGLHSQIRNAARILNKHYESFRGNEVVKIDYGQKTVKPETAATYSLLKYTPHTHGARLNSEVITNMIVASLER